MRRGVLPPSMVDTNPVPWHPNHLHASPRDQQSHVVKDEALKPGSQTLRLSTTSACEEDLPPHLTDSLAATSPNPLRNAIWMPCRSQEPMVTMATSHKMASLLWPVPHSGFLIKACLSLPGYWPNGLTKLFAAVLPVTVKERGPGAGLQRGGLLPPHPISSWPEIRH
jgi:hypothetical protein